MIHLFLFSILSLKVSASSTFLSPIQLAQPFDQQLYPPARVGQTYSWAFAPDTFTLTSSTNSTSSSGLTYTAPNLPSWLKFDDASRTLSGCPSENEIGLYTIAITATNPSADPGQSRALYDSFTLPVVNKPSSIVLHDPIKSQLTPNASSITSAYPFLPQSIHYPGVRVPPNWSFSLGFSPDTFTANSRVFYRATLDDGTPLPDWIVFNNQTVTLDGVAPNVSHEDTWRIGISGSDVFGYTDIVEYFNLTVAAHDLAVATSPVTYNATTGSFGSIAIDPTLLFQLDNVPLNMVDVAYIHVDTAGAGLDWAKWINANTSINGIPPSSLDGTIKVLALSLKDVYGDCLNTTINIHFSASVFSGPTFGPFVANISETVDIPLDQFWTNGTQIDGWNITATFDPQQAGSWLSLQRGPADTETMMRRDAASSLESWWLRGSVPSDATYDKVTANLLAEDPITHALSRAAVGFTLAQNGIPTTRSHHGLSLATIAAIAAVASLVGLLCLLCLTVLCCRRRRERRERRAREFYDGGEEEFKWDEREQGKEYTQPETPAMDYQAKMGEPPSAQMLVQRANVSDSALDSLPHLESSSPGWHKVGQEGTITSKILRNPFARSNKRVIPKISNPIIMPSFSNAAFQAQLAAAVDSAGIVKRGSTYDDGHSHETHSELTDSRMGDDMTGTGRTGTIGSGDGTDSQFQGDTSGSSSRASWESEPPFVWTSADTPGRIEAGHAMLTDDTASAPQSVDTHESSSTTSKDLPPRSGLSQISDQSIPVQRSDFRPSPPTTSHSATVIRHAIITGHGGNASEEEISIDNIHFPTDSDIAHTEASSDHEAVIHTASRVDARRTLDSPAASSPASSTTEKAPSSRGPSPSPVMTTHSRLVSFGKQKVVELKNQDTTGRNVSQTAVVHQSRSTATSHATHPSSPLSITSSGESTPRDPGRVPPDSPLPPAPVRTARAREIREASRSPSPPTSLPSLPALPSLPTVPSPLNQQRILLGVSEPFHFYPPLSISPSTSASSTASSTKRHMNTSSGTSYLAVVEEDGRTKGLPGWLHFEDMELWGVPGDADRGIWDVRIVEKRKGSEKIVGRFALEVVGRST